MHTLYTCGGQGNFCLLWWTQSTTLRQKTDPSILVGCPARVRRKLMRLRRWCETLSVLKLWMVLHQDTPLKSLHSSLLIIALKLVMRSPQQKEFMLPSYMNMIICKSCISLSGDGFVLINVSPEMETCIGAAGYTMIVKGDGREIPLTQTRLKICSPSDTRLVWKESIPEQCRKSIWTWYTHGPKRFVQIPNLRHWRKTSLPMHLSLCIWGTMPFGWLGSLSGQGEQISDIIWNVLTEKLSINWSILQKYQKQQSAVQACRVWWPASTRRIPPQIHITLCSAWRSARTGKSGSAKSNSCTVSVSLPAWYDSILVLTWNYFKFTGHWYMMYRQPDTPSIDAYEHLLTWLHFCELLLGRELQQDNYIFPSTSIKGTIDPLCPMTSNMVQKIITQFAKAAGIPSAKYFTTHCYQQGGVQYQFMFSPIGKRWTLAKIRWWGSWAESEKVSVIFSM